MKFKNQIFIVILALLVFLPYLGKVHLFDWDEINFAEAAREMIVTGDYLKVRIDFEPFHEKPPLFIWMQVASMKVFGINEFGARFPNAIIGIITLLVVYTIGKNLYDEKFGLLWVLAFIGSFLPHFYFKTGIIDPAFNLLMYLSMFYLYRYFEDKRVNPNSFQLRYLLIASVFNSLAILTKGPVGFLLVFLAWLIIWFTNRKSFKFPWKEMILFALIAGMPTILWYVVLVIQTGGDIINDFILYQIRLLTTGDAGHDGPFYYHFVIILLGCFPASIFLLRSFIKQNDDTITQNLFKYWNFALLGVVLLIFSIVKTKIVHYSSLSYFPVTFLAAYSMYKIINGTIKWKVSSNIFIGTIGLILSVLLTAFPIVLMNIELFLPKITDKFTNGLLQANPHWLGIEWVIGVIFLISLIVFFFFIYKMMYLKAFVFLYGASMLVLFMFLPLMAPQIEQYTQAAPIEFFNKLKDKDVYIHPLGYKSFAHFFYANRQLVNSRYYFKMNGEEYEKWLLKGKIDKPAYFTVKNTAADGFIKENPELVELYRKNGFVFLMRNSANN